MATGKKAFDKDSMPETLAAIIREQPPSLTSIDRSIPADLSAIVGRCLEKDRDRRYATTADLESELAGEQAVRSAASPRARSLRSIGRRLGPGLIALLVAGTGVLSWLALRPRTEPPLDPVVMVPLTSFPGSERDPSFSPDGSQIAFSWDGASGENWDIFVKVVGSEQPLRLTNDPARDSYPAWAPDGRSIAFLRTASEGGSEVRLVPPIGGPERLVAKLDTGYTFGLAWAPDSRHLIVSDHASPSGIVSLFLLDIESGTKEQLTWPSDPRSADSLAASSPDGGNLAFIRATPNAFELYVAPADGASPAGSRRRGAWDTPHGYRTETRSSSLVRSSPGRIRVSLPSS